MAIICKTISKTFTAEQLNTNCCGCDTHPWGSTAIPLQPIILEEVELGVFDFNPIQYIIPIKIACHGLLSCLDNASCCGDIVYYTKQPYSIKTVGFNPANVSFFWATGQTFSRTTSFGFSYSSPLNGLCMIVDRDPSHVETPKASSVQIEIQKCPSDPPFLQTIDTQNFFNYNYLQEFNAPCVGPNFAITPSIISAFATDMWNTTGWDYVNALCNEDVGADFRYPVVLDSGCPAAPGAGTKHPLKVIKAMNIVAKTIAGGGASTHPIVFEYDNLKGLWFLKTEKDAGGAIHTATTIQYTADIAVRDYCTKLNNLVNSNIPFDGKLSIQTFGATAPFTPFLIGSFTGTGTISSIC